MNTGRGWMASVNDLAESVMSFPMDLSADRTEVESGATIRLAWRAEDCGEAQLWQSEAVPLAIEPLNWGRIAELAETVPPRGERAVVIDDDTAFYLVASSAGRIKGLRLLVQVRREAERPAEPHREPSDSPRHSWRQDASHVAWPEPRPLPPELFPVEGPYFGLGPLRLSSGPPIVTLTAPPLPVIFTDESLTMEWLVSNTNCVTTTVQRTKTKLLKPDETAQLADKASGSKYDGASWGSGGSPGCGAPSQGSWIIDGQKMGPSSWQLYVDAKNAAGLQAKAHKWVDVLGVPNFTGNCTPERKASVRASLKLIDKRLQEGAVRDDAFLDSQVLAFKKGCLKRQEFYSRLLSELQNLDITTFECQDVASGYPPAQFEYGGKIFLNWRPPPKGGPDSYAIATELCHKAGFHEALYLAPCLLNNNEIEIGAEQVATAIFP